MRNAHDLVLIAKEKISEVAIDNAEHALHRADVIIDVREADEFLSGHLPGALNIPRGLLEFKMSSSEDLAARELAIVLYCKTSGRAALSALSLQEMGYTNVLSIAGGIDAWTQSGRAIVKPELPAFD